MNAKATSSQSIIDSQVRWSHRDIPLSHASHLCGSVAWTPPAQSVLVESQLEARVLSFLLGFPSLRGVHSQPFTLVFRLGARRLRYTPDFLVVYARVSAALRKLGFDHWTVVEVKPASRLDTDAAQITERLQAIRDLLGFATVCLTERDLRSGRALS